MSVMFMFAKRFVSGETREDAFAAVRRLNENSIQVSLDFLGEDVFEESETRRNTDEYLQMLEQMSASGVDGHVSLKLTMLGARLDDELCYENVSRICRKADEISMRVAIDMEGSDMTERTLRLYERAAKEFRAPEVVLQAYLKRTPEDVERVIAANGRLRLCKGAYNEPPTVALKAMPDIVAQYKKLVGRLLDAGRHVALASHDDQVIDFCRAAIRERGISTDRYEFQMLYGMREKTWHVLRAEGHPVCIYVPYGKHWFPYFRRRILERKENALFVLAHLFKD